MGSTVSPAGPGGNECGLRVPRRCSVTAADALGGAAQTTAVTFDATATGTHQALIDHLFTMGSLDIAICAAGIHPQAAVAPDMPLRSRR